MTAKKIKSLDARVTLGEHDDGKFVRSAIVTSPKDHGPSLDIVDKDGVLLARLNIFHDGAGGPLMVDVIDVDRVWRSRRVLGFDGNTRQSIDLQSGIIAASHFEGRVK